MKDIGLGYSGEKKGKFPESINTEAFSNEKYVGSIPKGTYIMDREFASRFRKSLKLWPSSSNNMFGRDSFTMHVGKNWGRNSQCCPIADLASRRQFKHATLMYVE
jgi:hypothetical protein